uniref:Activin_recp domain-containing protein n=1 Tax=Strongyloides venezuelensis TaxID=75913 RepID=A0A0K0G1Y7_STRVS
MIVSRYVLFTIFLLHVSKTFSLHCYDGHGEIENLGIISCYSQYCVSGVLVDGTKYHTCPSNSYCSWGSGCRRTKEAGEVFACCCSTDYCNSGGLYYSNTCFFLSSLLLFKVFFI